ncbi:hypothetical protein FGG08_001482 [Glutinoglossum americanum]|uniref:Porphobilinogen deaminase n=1 Tax=Glutinoglossum americanum TaxID=1670608 RepID=A0A9P8IDE6_9PEZI|nr:hypothetical protein FGG08_001482 [Glutinoglossum americanum]
MASLPATPIDPQPPSSSTTPTTIHIGSRKSVLALIQTQIVHDALQSAWPDLKYEIHAMNTMGDKNQVTPLHDFGAKSLWTHELEAGLVGGELDLIVHSLKDMPTLLPPTCALGAILPREDPRDALVLKSSLPQTATTTLSTLPPGSTIGTSSVRRSAQIARKNPHLHFADVRGNVGTRLAKLDAEGGAYTALVLAAAGLKRLGLSERITAYLDYANGGVMHAVGQGALGVEIRAGDERMRRLLEPLVHVPTTLACLAERAVMRTLEGGCSVPIGVETEWVGVQALRMRVVVVSLDGGESVEGLREGRVGSVEEAEAFGREVAGELVERGAGRILEAIGQKKRGAGDGD